jgi:hypothetical protein
MSLVWRMRLSRSVCRIVCSPCLWEWSGVESNQPPATYQIAMLPLQHRTSCRVGMVGVEPTRSCSQNTRAAVTPHPVVSSQSERPDSNRRSPGPRPGGVAALLRSGFSSSSGSRTPASGLKGRHPQPLDERAVLFVVSGSGGARILVSWFSARCYTVSATDP